MFYRFPLTNSEFKTLKDAGFKICLVSPELQGRNAEEIQKCLTYSHLLRSMLMQPCTKYPVIWERLGLIMDKIIESVILGRARATITLLIACAPSAAIDWYIPLEAS